MGQNKKVKSLFGDNYDRDNSYGSGRNSAPINVGEEHEVKIEDLGRDGDGIARIEGFVIFVTGDEVKIKINSTRRNFAFAEIVE
jgi:predicted RNA-binding protein with TRAM domain